MRRLGCPRNTSRGMGVSSIPTGGWRSSSVASANALFATHHLLKIVTLAPDRGPQKVSRPCWPTSGTGRSESHASSKVLTVSGASCCTQ